MTTNNPSIGEIWLVKFAFEEKQGFKQRPAAVISLDRDPETATVVKITTHPPRKEFPGEFWIANWKSAGLKKRSCIRASKTLRIPLSGFSSAKLIGTLSELDMTRLRNELSLIHLRK